MPFALPPPDPNETYTLGDEEWPLTRPTTVFLAGTPSPEGHRISDKLLKLRPGALIVFASG